MFKIKRIAIGFIAILLTIGIGNYHAAAQDYNVNTDSLMNRSKIKGPLDFKGHVEELSKKLKGAIVTLYESPDGSHDNLTEIFRTVTPGNGEFKFKLEINKFYVLSVEKGGYTTKKIDFDTDVTLAREKHTEVPLFEFRVDMVKDLDGLAFVGSVASVFYQIKTNTFNYELDYSKEEMEDEERALREKQEKERLAKLAYEKKKQLEEAARLLLEKENATAQQLIEAAILVGDGDKDKTTKGFLEVFSEVDSLRDRKAAAMYDQLLEERIQSKATGSKLNFQAIFDAAKTIEDQIVAEFEKEREAQTAILRQEKEEAERKSKEAMAIAQKAIEVEASEKLAAAIAEEEAKRKKEEIEKRDKIYYAIFDSNGNSEVAIQNLIKTYPKGDPYKEQKAKAIFEEYEKTRLTGTTLSNMDFGKLFEAADIAEQKAIQEEIAGDNAKQNSRLDAFMKKVEERKQQEQKETSDKILKGLKEASPDKASQIAVFIDALPKNESYKEKKAEAMYEQYVQQKQALPQIETALKNAPNNKEAQIAAIYNSLPAGTPDREGTAQRMYEEYTASKQAQGGTGSVSMDFGSMFKAAEIAEKEALQEDKARTVEEKQKAQEQLEARRDAVRQEKRELASKAEKEVEQVHRAGIAQAKNKKERDLAEAIETGAGDRDKTVEAIRKVLAETGDKELDRERAEAVYDSYLQQSAEIKKSGNLGTKIDFASLFSAAEQAELARLERQFEAKQLQEQEKLQEYEERRTEKAIEIAKAQQKQAEYEAEEAAIAYEEALHKTEVARQERLNEQKREEEELAKKLAMEQARREVAEKERAEGELAVLERERLARLEKEQAEADALAAAEAERKRKEQEQAEKEAREQLALLEKQKREAEMAEAKRLADEEAERKQLALAEAKAAEEARKAEEKRLADLENERKAQALAEAKAAADAKKAEEKRLADLENERKAKELADAKAAEEARKLAEKQAEELAKQQAEEAERKRKSNYDALIFRGDQDLAKNDFRSAWKNYQDALALYPGDKDATKKFNEADAEVKRLDKEQAEQLALDEKYNALILEGQNQLEENEYDKAKITFAKASELKPAEQEPKQQIRNIDRILDQLAAEEKERQKAERQYILLMQEGAKLFDAGNLADAKVKYQEAANMKPDELEPVNKLEKIQEAEDQIALAKAEEQRRKDEAKREFERKQEEERKRKEEEAERLRLEREARQLALDKVDENKASQQKTVVESEKERIAAFERLQESVNDKDLTAEQRRQQFLSELAKIYPEGLTQETVEGKNFVLLRHVINENNVVTVYEKKTWDWGGVFYFKDADIAITEAIYKLEIGKY